MKHQLVVKAPLTATVRFLCRISALILFLVDFAVPVFGASSILNDSEHKLLMLSDGQGQLALRLNYNDGCVVDQINVLGRNVQGMAYTGVRIGDGWFTSRMAGNVAISIDKTTVTVNGIKFGKSGEGVQETWTFTSLPDRIVWRITRRYCTNAAITEVALPKWEFGNAANWTGGILDNGGVVLSKYLDHANATYGGHFGTVTFWNDKSDDCLRIEPSFKTNLFGAGLFARQTNDVLAFSYAVTAEQIKTKYGQSRFLGDRQDLWEAFQVQPSEVTAEFALQALEYDKAYDRGTFVGLDGNNINELLNTVARYGTIDSQLVGGNGWRSGYICLHEPFFAQIAAALDAGDYTHNLATFLDNARDHAIETNGRVKSRWCYGAWDAMPGSYDEFGFYEAQWGYLMDSQPDYVMNVAELFNLTADKKWLASHKESCEHALEFLMHREVGDSGLIAMMTDSHKQSQGSDWIDVIWASYENAFVNAQLYAALNLWAGAEETLNDTNKAKVYRNFAVRLKTSFNKSTAKGGFWDPTNQWYVYWRDKDDSIHGNNLVTPVNFAAIAYGLCDDSVRKKAILDRMESEMEKENLFYWPLSFFPYGPDDGAGNNFPNYENGDIFLSWGELGVRAYSTYDSSIALKYVKSILDRYGKDGLSFQRYLRRSQSGEGGDILAGNCMPIVGLFRDIYGIQPRPNCLYFDPHLPSELNGTLIHYKLRDYVYEIGLGSESSQVTAENVTIRSPHPFAINVADAGLQYFHGQESDWSLSIQPIKGMDLTIQIVNWPHAADDAREWIESSQHGNAEVSHIIRGLKPKADYRLYTDGRVVKSLRTDDIGQVKCENELIANVPKRFMLKSFN